MTDNEPNYLPTLEALLPESQAPFTQTLIKLIWVRPDGRFLVAAATRLRQLLAEHSDRFPASVQEMIPLATLDLWLESVRDLQKTPLSVEHIKVIDELCVSPFGVARLLSKEHVNHGLLKTFPLYSALLTTRLTENPQKKMHDEVTAWLVGHAMAHVKDVKWCLYQTYIADTKRAPTSIPHGSSLVKAAMAIRTLQRAEIPASVLDRVTTLLTPEEIEPVRKEVSVDPAYATLAQHLGYLEAFLLERYRDQDKDKDKEKKEKKDEDDKEQPIPRIDRTPEPFTPRPPRNETLSTYLDLPEFIFTAAPDLSTSELVEPTASEDELELARSLDLALIEVVGAPIFVTGVLGHIDLAPDDSSLGLHTQNQIKFKRRQNQFHRWRSDYVPLDTRRAVIEHLKTIVMAVNGVDSPDPRQIYAAAAAALILVSIATGRKPATLATKFDVHATNISIPTDGLTTLYDLDEGTLSIRPNRADTKGQATNGSRVVDSWLTVPDFIGLDAAMRVFANIWPDLNRSTVLSSINRVEAHQLKSFGVTTAQLAELLPRQLLELTGHFSTTVLLTDWAKSSSTVDLHYLTPGSRYIYLRYVAAMRALLPAETSTALEQKISTLAPTGYIGMPNTPDWGHLEETIEALQAAIHDHTRTPQARHNAFTLYVIMKATFALGLRHTVDIQLGRRHVGERAIAFFREKDDDRLLVIPARLNQQLDHYDRHAEAVLSWPGITAKIKALGSPQFFIFNVDGEPKHFHPTRFSEYLESFNIPFPLPLNSLRRAVFSELVDLGIRGIVTDHYIGHAAEGREPLVTGSAFRLHAMEDLADEIDLLLKAHKWPVTEGPFHG